MTSQSLTTLENIGDNVFLLTLNTITFSPPLIEEIHLRLNELDKIGGTMGLITTSNHNKAYSSGVNFKVFTLKEYEFTGFLLGVGRLLARIMTLGYPTMAMINGHCLALGLIFALAHDFRFMANNTSKFHLNEISNGVPIPQGMMTILTQKLSPHVLRDMVLFAKPYSAQECLENRIVDKLIEKPQLLEQTKEFMTKMKKYSKHRSVMSQLKSVLYKFSVEHAQKDFLADLRLIPKF